MPSDNPPTTSPDSSNESRPSARSSGSAESSRHLRIGRYEIIRPIATGGMGKVFRARDTQENRDVALKILEKDAAAKPNMVERFRREARSAMKLDHENVVSVFDAGEAGGHHYIAMEYVDGIDLHDYVKRKGSLDPEEARQIVLQAARALQHANDLHIVHRDVKPSNFILTKKNGRLFVKLTDFGLAREVSADEFRVTRAGTTVGTVDYMSPEQAKDSSAADVRSDLYSLGTTWFHLLTGQAPFHEGGLGERIIKIMTQEPPDARDLNERVSDDTWAILSRLLEKDPDDRYQTPGELIDALIALEGSAVANPRVVRKPVRKKNARRPRPDAEVSADASADGKGGRWPYVVGVLALCAIVCVVAALVWSKRNRDRADQVVTPPVSNDQLPVVKAPDEEPPPKDNKDRVPPPRDKEKPPVVATWPALYRPLLRVDLAALRQEIEKPFGPQLSAGEPFVARVSRVGGPETYRTLGDAVAAAPSGRPIVVEIHDNGPLFELPVRAEGRRLSVRAGKGYRPLIIWDVQATVERRLREKKNEESLAFISVDRGSLDVQGLELALRWPASQEKPGALLDVSGDLSLIDCTVSVAGKANDFALARLRGSEPRCRFTRLHARGQALTALDLDVIAAEVLFDGCLIHAGDAPLIKSKGSNVAGPTVRLVRSTLLARGLIDHRPAAEVDLSAKLDVLCWDCLLAHAGSQDAGDLLTLRDKISTRGVEWRAVNSLYVGWRHLLGGAESVSAREVKKWRELWKRPEGDESLPQAWPEQASSEPASLPAATYAPTKVVGYASSVNADKPLGCDLPALPACRDGWVSVALEPTLALVDALSDNAAPEIPDLDDGLYHGGKFDLTGIDLGAELEKKWKTTKPGPKVVLHLRGKGDTSTSPIRLKGSSLVLYFEEPADDKAARPMLRLSTTDPTKALVDVEDGGVDVINGGLKVADVPNARGTHLIRVKGGDVRLYRTRLEGPQTQTSGSWVAALSLTGSGDESPEKARVCAINESVVLSNKAGVMLDGVGHRLLVRQSVIVAGDAVVVRPGADCKGRANVQGSMQQSTLAARSAVLRLGDAATAKVLVEPVVIHTRDCAFLEPFATSKGGVLVCEGDSLARGLLVWQSERDAIDRRFWFMAKQADAAVERSETSQAWRRLWGSGGVKSPRADVGGLADFSPKRWELERLYVGREAAGADVEKLGLKRKR